MSEVASAVARNYFDDMECEFLRETAQAPYGGWASQYGIQDMTSELATHILDGDTASFERVLEQDEVLTNRLFGIEEFRRLVLLGLAFGVKLGDAACANYLGALYYMGDVLPQDFHRAKELYELADSKGIVQATINLGYIYEYGRVGEPDHVRAYMQYAKAVALSDHPEALYKLGDMYSRGQAVPRDLHTALALWDRSLQTAQDEAMQAQPAFRIAKLISDPASAENELPYDLMGALRLFQLAERGLMIAVAQGETFYQARLAEAVEGQERMRALLRSPEGQRYLEG